MKCLILAAGYATRLYPLTENFPKPLLKVGDKTILDWLLADIDRSGKVDGYIVVSNHKFAPHFAAWAVKHPLPITVLDDGTETNETRLGAVRDIAFALKETGLTDDILIIAGDNLLDFSLTTFLTYADEKRTSVSMRYWEADEKRLRRSGVSEIDEHDRLIGLEEKPENPRSHWCTPPFYLYHASDIARVEEAIGDGCGVDAPGSLLSWMAKHTVIHSMEMPGKRYDIGTMESYEAVKRVYRGVPTS